MARVDAAVRAEMRAMPLPSGPGHAAARRRRLLTITVAGALLAGSAATGAAIWVSHGAGDPITGVTPGGRAALSESPTLASAAWLFQQNGAPHIATVPRRPAIQFPPGTTYRAALNLLLRSVAASGSVPPRSRVVAPLPAGIVWRTGTKRRGPRLDLTAPWGYTLPSGLVRAPSLTVDPSIPRRDAAKIIDAFMAGTPIGTGRAKGLSADAPRLARCQIQIVGKRTPRCAITPPKATR